MLNAKYGETNIGMWQTMTYKIGKNDQTKKHIL